MNNKNADEARIKKTIGGLSADYKTAKKNEYLSEREFKKYEKLYLAEKELFKIKKKALESAKLRLNIAIAGELAAEKEFKEERKRLNYFHQTEKNVKLRVQKKARERKAIQNEMVKLSKEAKRRMDELKSLLYASKHKFKFAQRTSDKALKNVLRKGGFKRVKSSRIKKTKRLIGAGSREKSVKNEEKSRERTGDTEKFAAKNKNDNSRERSGEDAPIEKEAGHEEKPAESPQETQEAEATEERGINQEDDSDGKKDENKKDETRDDYDLKEIENRFKKLQEESKS